MIESYLRMRSNEGTHYDTLRDISSSISMACVEATDGKLQPGKSHSVTTFLHGERRAKPVRRLGTGEYSDVALLFQEIWLYGPTSALTLGHKKARAILCLAADTAARPSDIAKLFRIYNGWRQQIVYTTNGMKVRFFFPKEVDPGSSRNNATGYYFSSWVEVRDTTPVEISTPACFRDFLDSSSGPEYESEEIPLLDTSAQAFVYGQKRNGVFRKASVDHIAKVVKNGLDEAGMSPMTAKSIRGASPSKIVQLFPDLLSEALKLGRWTTQKTFNNHYQAPVKLLSSTIPPDSIKGNLQQILRWGFEPAPPLHVSARDYMKGPEFWVSKTIPRLGTIKEFDEGLYTVVASGGQSSFYHYELMAEVSKSRSSVLAL